MKKRTKIIIVSLLASVGLVILAYVGFIVFFLADDLITDRKTQELRDDICREGRLIVEEFLNEKRQGATLTSLYTEFEPSDYEPLVYSVVIGKFEYEGKEYKIACNVTDHAIYTNEKEETISTYITEEIKKKSFIPDTKVERVFLNLFYPIRTTAYYISGKKAASKQDVFSTEEFFMPVESTDEELIEYVSGIFNDDEVFPKATVNLSYEGGVETLEKEVNLNNISGNSIVFCVNCSNGEFEAYNSKKDSKDVIFVKHTYHREYEVEDLERYVYDERLEYNYYPDTAKKDITSQKTFDTSDFSFEYSSEEDEFAVLNLPRGCFANVYIKDTKGVNRVYYKYQSNDKDIYCNIVDCGDGWYEIKSEKLEWIFNDGTIVFRR